MATQGAIITDFGDYDKGQFVQVQSDDKIVVMGTSGDNLAVARYNTNGSLDKTFGTNGTLTAKAVMTINTVYPLNDGSFLTVGSNASGFAVARYNSDVSLDTSFNKDGKVTTHVWGVSTAYNVAVQADGKLLVVGKSNEQFSAVRYNSDGSLDRSFSGDAKIYGNEISYVGAVTCVAIQPDGKTVLAGYANDWGVVRLDRYGNLDASFSGSGKLVTDIGGKDAVYTVNVLSTGKILAAGTSDGNFAVARYNFDGSLDTSFSGDGIVINNLGGTETLKSVIALTDGKFLAAGTTGDYNMVLVRYNADGSLDTTFDKDGIATTDLGGWEEGNSLSVQKDGKILVVGSSDTDIALVRYNTDGSLDTNFNGTGGGTEPTPDPTDNGNTNPDTTPQTDTGTASVKITPTDLQTNEQGDTAKLSVILTSAPTRDVSISFTSSDTSEGKLDKTELTFTSANWATPQILTVTGQNDSQVDGNIAYTITGEIATIDVRYKSVKVGSITLTNQDTPVVGAETVNGTDGTDILQGTDAPTYMLGKAGDDDCSGGGGNDTIYGSYGADVLFGEDDNDYLYGEQDADYMDGGRGNDSLDGGLGKDTMIGGVGNDTYILGYDAVDTIQDSGLPNDIDTVIMPYQLNKYTLPNGIENGTIADGTGGNLTGNTSNNSLTGNAGNNSLNGGAGNDTLSGGDGKDSFIFNSVLKANLDKITDFSPKFDRIQLDDAVFRSLHTGTLTASAFNTGGALDSSDRIIYNKTTGALLYDDDGAGGHAAVQIATLGVKLAVSASDFLIV